MSSTNFKLSPEVDYMKKRRAQLAFFDSVDFELCLRDAPFQDHGDAHQHDDGQNAMEDCQKLREIRHCKNQPS